MTLRFSQATHTPVYSRSSADEIGRVIRYVVDAGARRVVAVHVSGRRRRALLADWAHVVGFGPDAVVVDDEDSLRPPAGDHEHRVVGGDLDLRGRRVLTDSGYELGALVDVEFDESDGQLTRVETDRTTVDGSGLLAIGGYAVVVRHDAVVPAEEPPAT